MGTREKYIMQLLGESDAVNIVDVEPIITESQTRPVQQATETLNHADKFEQRVSLLPAPGIFHKI